MLISETHFVVRYAETDQMGIVHHSNYYAWFEVGRTEFFSHTGMTYGQLEKQGILFPLIESSCVYKEGARYEDQLIIRTWIHELKGARVIFNYEVVRDKDGKVLAKGQTVHAFVNKDFKPINIKKENKMVWNRLYELSVESNR